MGRLRHIPFAEDIFSYSDECAICLTKYQENDDVTVLPCNEKHYFHTVCIKDWL